MADITVAPKIRCDNCGFTADKVPATPFRPATGGWHRPYKWGTARLISGREMTGYPGEELRFIDLCPNCAKAAHDAAAEALRIQRKETSDERSG